MPVNLRRKHFRQDLGVDLGTSNCLICQRNQGIIYSEPAVVAVRKSTNQLLAVGSEARQMVGRTPGDIMTIQPLRHGVIVNFEMARDLLKNLFRKALGSRRFIKPRVVASIASGTTEVERRAFSQALEEAGAREVLLVEEPIAAAIGSELSVYEATGNMIVNVGGGTTDVAIIALGGIVSGRCIPVGGDNFDQAITRYVQLQYQLMVGEQTAEDLKIHLGSAIAGDDDLSYDVYGRDQLTGLPKYVTLHAAEIRDCLKEPLLAIINAIHQTVEHAPPELVADLISREMVLTGGGVLLRDFDKLVAQQLGLPVKIASEPMSKVALGTGIVLEELAKLSRLLVQIKNPPSKK